MPRSIRVFGPGALLGFAMVAALIAYWLGGGATPQLIADPGPVVRWMSPFAALTFNLGTAGTLGALALALWALTPGEAAHNRAIDIASASAVVMTIGAGLTGFLTFLDVTGLSVEATDQFGAQLAQFFGGIPLGQAWLFTTLIAAAVSVACFAVRNQTALIFVAVAAVGALVPQISQGHAAGSTSHTQAVNALGMHLVFAAVWLGGLVTFVLIARQLERARLAVVLARYSTLALVAFIVVAISGYASAAIRIGAWNALAGPYGTLVLIKVGALVALGILGAMQRRRVIRSMQTSATPGRWLAGLVVLELAFMGVASGVAVALARTATPVAQAGAAAAQLTPTPAERLTGEALPPWPELWRYVTEWRIDPLWATVCAFAIFFYLAGVVRLRRRGDRWPVLRAVSWCAGILVLFYLTNGGVAVYERALFSAHMLGHMGLTMVVPVLLVPGAPVTLAARAIRARTDTSRGGREWILTAVHSRFAGIITNPVLTAVLFAGSLWVFYYTPLFRWAVTEHLGHQWMLVHFLLTGYLFVQSLIGIDPVKHRLGYPFRLVLLLATMAFHAFFGLAIMSGTALMLPDWYGAMGWGTDAILDQQLGGGLAWSVGELPTVAIAITVAMLWSRSDDRESRRHDRNADRTGDAELEAYNAGLAALARRSQ